MGSISGLGRSPGEGNDNLLQYSCLENSMNRGARWATIHGVEKNQTCLSACMRTHTWLIYNVNYRCTVKWFSDVQLYMYILLHYVFLKIIILFIWLHGVLVQFSSVSQSCPMPCDPMHCSTPSLPVHHQLPEFTQTHIYWVVDAIQPSHPLSSPSPPAFNLSQHQGLFKWVSSSHQVAKILEFQRQH